MSRGAWALVLGLGCAMSSLAQTAPTADPNHRVQAVVPESAVPGAKPAPLVGLQFAIVNSAWSTTREGMTYSGGDIGKGVTLNYSAVLVQHPMGSFLFDTGLGRQVDVQYGREMPWWAKAFFQYKEVVPVRDQLERANVALPQRIYLSHIHWDHASGVVDFPDAEVWVSATERAFGQQVGPPVVLPSQIHAKTIRWRELVFSDKPVLGVFTRSLDLFGDGSAVLVPMPGHTPGSTGLLLRTGSGRQVLFVGDTVWNAQAIALQAPKILLARRLADANADAVQRLIGLLHELKRQHPEVMLVPAHDRGTQNALGYFPDWVR